MQVIVPQVDVQSELHVVWKTLVDAADNMVDVMYKEVDAPFTLVAVRGASDDVRCRRVGVPCKVVDASCAERDAIYSSRSGV